MFTTVTIVSLPVKLIEANIILRYKCQLLPMPRQFDIFKSER